MTKQERRIKTEKKEFKDKISTFKSALEVHLTWYHQTYKNNFKGYEKCSWETKNPAENKSLKDFKLFVRRLTQYNNPEHIFSQDSATNGQITIPILNGIISFPDKPKIIAEIYLNLPEACR